MRKILFVIGELEEQDIDWLIRVGRKVLAPPGTILIEQGRPMDSIYIVLDGELLVRSGTRELARIGCGEIVGELSFLDTRPPAATVQCRTAAELLAIPRPTLSGKLSQDTGFAARFYRALGVLLAYRLRNQATYQDGAQLNEEIVYDDELDQTLLDQVALASARFDWMLRRLAAAPASCP